MQGERSKSNIPAWCFGFDCRKWTGLWPWLWPCCCWCWACMSMLAWFAIAVYDPDFKYKNKPRAAYVHAHNPQNKLHQHATCAMRQIQTHSPGSCYLRFVFGFFPLCIGAKTKREMRHGALGQEQNKTKGNRRTVCDANALSGLESKSKVFSIHNPTWAW